MGSVGALGTSLERHDSILVPDGTSEEKRMAAAESLVALTRDPRDPSKTIPLREAMVLVAEQLPPERQFAAITDAVQKYGVVPEELWHLVFGG